MFSFIAKNKATKIVLFLGICAYFSACASLSQEKSNSDKKQVAHEKLMNQYEKTDIGGELW